MKIPIPFDWGHLWVGYDKSEYLKGWKVTIGFTIYTKKMRQLKKANRRRGKDDTRTTPGT